MCFTGDQNMEREERFRHSPNPEKPLFDGILH